MGIYFSKALADSRCGHYHILKQDAPEIPEFPLVEIADKVPNEPEWKKIHSIADGQTNLMIESIVDGTNEVKDDVNMSQMKEGFRDNSINVIEAAIGFTLYDSLLRRNEGIIGNVFIQVGQSMKVHLPPSMRGFRFDSATPRAIAFVERSGANLVKEIGLGTRNAIRNEIKKALVEGLGVDRNARNIRNIIGLTERQAGAVTRFRKASLESGLSNEVVERRTKEYSERLLKARAENIARTELMTAANQGHLEMLRQGVEEGLIPADTKRVWIVTPDDRLCPLCRPMEGQETGIFGMFVSAKGNIDAPPLHPQCRCATGEII